MEPEYVIYESSLNYHSIEELETFKPYSLHKIREARKSKDAFVKKMISELFDDFTRYYPEQYFVGIHVVSPNGDIRNYKYQRSVKNKFIRGWFKTPDAAIRFALKVAKKYNLKVYRDERKNNRFPKKI